MTTRIVLSVLFLMLAGCAQIPRPAEGVRAATDLPLLEPASLGRSLSLSQIVRGEHDGKTYRARYELEITSDRLAIVMLSPIGITLSTIVYENGAFAVENYTQKAPSFDPRYTLFDLYLTYWPVAALREVLEPIGLRLDESKDGSMRQLRDEQGQLVAEITYAFKDSNTKIIAIRHFDIPYQINIVSLGGESGR